MHLIRIATVAAATGLCLAFPYTTVGDVLAKDAGGDTAYAGGWKSGTNGGNGFAAWTLTSAADTGVAGFFQDTSAGDDDIRAAAGGAFGTYANGSGFPQAVAFRSLSTALAVGQAFHVTIDNGGIASGGAVGIVLRTGTAASGVTDYNNGSRAEVAFIGGGSTYSAFDGSSTTDTGVGFTSGGIDVNFVRTATDTYNLYLTNRSTNVTTALLNRTLGGTKGAAINSIALFNRDANQANAYFNNLQQVSTQTYTGPAGGAWSNAANWNGGVVPSNGDSVAFGAAAGGTVTNDLLNAVNSITFTNSAGAYTVADSDSSATLQVGTGGIVNASTAAQTISANIRLLAAQTFDAGAANASVTSTGVLSGSYALTKIGAGTLTLAGGTTAVPSGIGSLVQTAGTVNLNGVINVGAGTSADEISVSGGGILNVSGAVSGNFKTFIIGDGSAGTLNVNGGSLAVTTKTSTTSGVAIGASIGGVTSGASGVVNVTAGTMTINSPVLIGAGDTVTGSAGNYTTDGAAAGTLTIGGTGKFVAAGAIFIGNSAAASGTLNLQTGGTLSTGTGISGAGTGGTGTVNFDGGTLLATGPSTFTLLSGVNAANVLTGGVTINANGSNVTISQALLHGGAAAIDHGVTVTGGGTLTLTGANTYTGDTVIGDNTFLVTGGTSLRYSTVVDSGSLSSLTFNNTTATLGGLSGTQNVSLTYSGMAIALTTGGNNASTIYSGVLASTKGGNVTKTGSGTFALAASNTYTGATTVSQGILQANGAKTYSSDGTTVTGSATGLGNVAVGTNGTLVGTGQVAGTVNVSGTISAGTGATLGDGAGNLTTGAQTWNGGSKDVIKFVGSTHTGGGVAQPGKDFDLLTIGGLLNLSDKTTPGLFQIVLTKATNGTFGNPVNGTRFEIAAATGITSTNAAGTTTSYTGTTADLTALFTLTDGDVGLSPTSFSVLAAPDAATGGEDLLLQYNGNSSAPEAGTLALTAVAAVPLLGRRGRRTA